MDARIELIASYAHLHPAPVAIFERVAGFGMPVAAGVFASRDRVALLLGSRPDRLPFDFLDALARPVPPVMTDSAPCQEVILRPAFDLRRLLPAPTYTPQDAGPFITAGLVRAHDPETGEANVAIHRLCLHGPDTLSIYFAPGRRIGRFHEKAERMGRALPVSVSIGLDPAVYLGACAGPAGAPPSEDELAYGGALRGRPIKLARCLTVDAEAIAHAEIVIEGEILPGIRVREDAPSGTGYSMPEFHGYMGVAEAEAPVLRATAVTHRRDPIFQTMASRLERATLIGIPTEAGIVRLAEKAAPGALRTVHAHPSGGGSYMAVIQFAAGAAPDARRAVGTAALDAFRELRLAVLVDEDVNPFDSDDVLWAIATRFQGETGAIIRPGPELRFLGPSSKTLLDCCVGSGDRAKFRRS